MGCYWNSVIVKGNKADIDKLVLSVMPLCELIDPPIRLDICAFNAVSSDDIWSLELTGVNTRNELTLSSQIKKAQTLINKAKINHKFKEWLAVTPEFALAVLADALNLEPTWIFYSDGIGESAFVSIRNSEISSQQWLVDYGEISEEKFDYGSAAINGIHEHLPEINFIDDEIFQTFYDDNATCYSWCLMRKKQILRKPEKLNTQG